MLILRIIGWLVGGSLPVCAALWAHSHAQASAAPRIPGVVYGHDPREDSDGTTYALQVRYTDAHGQEQRFTTKISTSPPAFEVGAPVTVVITEGGPRILSFAHQWMPYGVWFCVALCALGLSLGPPIFSRVHGLP